MCQTSLGSSGQSLQQPTREIVSYKLTINSIFPNLTLRCDDANAIGLFSSGRSATAASVPLKPEWV